MSSSSPEGKSHENSAYESSSSEEVPSEDTSKKVYNEPKDESEGENEDNRIADEMINYLDNNKVYKISELSDRINRAISKIGGHFESLIKETVEKQEIQCKDDGEIKYKIIPVGSAQFGITFDDQEIDMVGVFPSFITNDLFFTKLFQSFEKDVNITSVLKARKAFIPTISLVIDGLKISLSRVSIKRETVDDSFDFDDDDNLKEMDKYSKRALGSLRNNNLVIGWLAPNKGFKDLLRFLIYWTKRRGIYGDLFGYFNYASLCIISAYICQLYPNKPISVLFYELTLILAEWEQKKPIYINTPKKYKDESEFRSIDFFPIFTPSYPSYNSFNTVTVSSYKIIRIECARAHELMKSVYKGTSAIDSICEEHTFFHKNSFKRYIRITYTADDYSDFSWWTGSCIAKLRRLIVKLDEIQELNDTQVFPQMFINSSNAENGKSLKGTVYIGLNYNSQQSSGTPSAPVTKKININDPLTKYFQQCIKVEKDDGARPNSCSIDEPELMKHSDLPSHLKPDKKKKKKKSKGENDQKDESKDEKKKETDE